jgi:hypothetical protein
MNGGVKGCHAFAKDSFELLNRPTLGVANGEDWLLTFRLPRKR